MKFSTIRKQASVFVLGLAMGFRSNDYRAKQLLLGIGLVFCLVTPASALAVTINVVGGQLVGANEVDVGGTLFDVTFFDGSCAINFTGCNQPQDFDFNTEAAALEAAQALLDQVFIDTAEGLFDSDPSLTFGCSASPTVCRSFIPLEQLSTGQILGAQAVNNNVETADRRSLLVLLNRNNEADNLSMARFTASAVTPEPVPEPGTIALLSTGLLGLAGYRWRQRRREKTHVG